jgi:4'-phosphopantetheinyl transferase
VHLWYCALDDSPVADLLERCMAVLSSEERERYDRLRIDREKRRFLISHAALRGVLSSYAARPPAEWAFELNAHGKPFVAPEQNPEGLLFNLSHSADAALVAVASGLVELGVDIEFHRQGRRLEQLARRNFAPAEVRALETAAPSERAAMFYDFWSLKESFVKARGMGLSMSLRSFAFSLDRGAGLRFEFAGGLGESPAGWQFWSYRLPGPFSAALALKAASGQPVGAPRWFSATPLGAFEPMQPGAALST